MKRHHYMAILILINLLLLGVMEGCLPSSTDETFNNQPTQLSFTEEDFRNLYPSWTLLGEKLVTFGQDIYTVIVMGQPDYQNEANIRICICKHTDRWLEIWHIPKDLQSECVDESSLIEYPEIFLQNFEIIKNDNAALIAANVLVGGAHGTTQVAILTLDKNGECLLKQLDSSGIMTVKKEDNYIKVTGEGEYGIHNLYLKNGEFHNETVLLSETGPAQAIKLEFIVASDGTVYPAKTKDLSMKVDQTIAFVPANEEANKLFNAGEIYIYSDAWNGPPLTACEANRIKTGNSYTFDKTGLCHFLLILSNRGYNEDEPTFNIVVQP